MPGHARWEVPAARLDRLLGEAGIDLLVASSKHNVRYLLGAHHHRFFAHMDAIGVSRYLPLLVYPARRPGDAAYVANRNEKDSIAVRASEGRALWPGTILPGASGSREAMGLAVEHIRRLGEGGGTIGVEMAFLPADAYLALRDAFPDARIVDAHRPLERLRAVKSASELDLLRDASDRVIDAMLAVIGESGPGMPHPRRGFIKLEDTVAVTDRGWEAFGDRGRGWNRGAA